MVSMQHLCASGNLYRTTRQHGQASAASRPFRTALCSAKAGTTQKQSARAGSGSSSAIQKHVAKPITVGAALTGFSLVAAGIFPPANNEPSYLAESAMRLLPSTGLGAAQAATTQAAASASDPTVTTVSTAADPAASVLSSPLLDLDQAVHTFVTTHTSVDFRAVAADIYISDVFITAGIFGWLICTAMCLQAGPKKAAVPLSLAWAFYFTTCGAYSDSDPLLVNFLKHVFARIRPSPMHHTFSFPSGHTSAAVFIVGALVTVLLPLTVQLLTERKQATQPAVEPIDEDTTLFNSSSSNSSSGGSTERYSERVVDSKASSYQSVSGTERFWEGYDAAALAIWGAAWVTTATGRVLADAHWVSDTLAGGCLAIASVSGLAWCCRFLDQGINSSGDGNRSAAAQR